MKIKFYSEIAKNYDLLIKDDIEKNQFPYAGYDVVMELISEDIFCFTEEKQLNILDIGIGTGYLYERFKPSSVTVYGIDNCQEMLEVAKLRLPEATLLNHDFQNGLPEELDGLFFDYIVLNFTVNHFDFEFLVSAIESLVLRLGSFGKIIISDLMFHDGIKKVRYFNKFPDNMITGLYFHTYDRIVKRVNTSLKPSFMEINDFTGILIIEKKYESSLHIEDCLVKYKSNTVKWKSSQPQKKSE